METQESPSRHDAVYMADIPLSPDAKVVVERRGQIVVIAINRPEMLNRIDPDTFYGLAKAYHDFDHDPTLRAAVLVGHGEHFCRGNDVEAFSALAKSGKAVRCSTPSARVTPSTTAGLELQERPGPVPVAGAAKRLTG